ncbi:MAG: hypothetical protein IKT50_03770, partial [Clostridia bacterium]|nr:hypothetical protein [Clostridia bacterium]
MKHWQYHPVTKTICGFLAAVLLFCTIVSATAVIFLLQENGYMASFTDVKDDYLAEYYNDIPFRITEQYVALGNKEHFARWLEFMEDVYSFTCEITDVNGTVLYSDHKGEKATYRSHDIFYFYTDENGVVWNDWDPVAAEYQVTLYGYAPKAGSGEEMYLNVLQLCHRYRFFVLGSVFVSAILFGLLTIFLCSVAGRREKDGEIRFGFWSRVPAEIVLA